MKRLQLVMNCGGIGLGTRHGIGKSQREVVSLGLRVVSISNHWVWSFSPAILGFGSVAGAAVCAFPTPCAGS